MSEETRLVAADSVDMLFLKGLVERMDAYAGLEHQHTVAIGQVIGSDRVQVVVRSLDVSEPSAFLATIRSAGKFGSHNMVEVYLASEKDHVVVMNAVPKMVLAVLLEW